MNKVKVSQKTVKKVIENFFNKKWQVVGRPDFPSILPAKSGKQVSDCFWSVKLFLEYRIIFVLYGL